MWRRHLASASQHLLDDAATLSSAETQMSVCFVDIVGYTTQSRSLDGADLVEWVDRFEQDTTTLVVDHGGQVIKTIGDEVLFTVPDPAAAVAIALALTARGDDAEDPFPAVRVGIAHGAVVRRLGDVFGSTVNAASRLTSAARPGTVLVDAGVHEALTDDDASGRPTDPEPGSEQEWRWRRVRRVPAKGFKHLEAWRVRRAPTDRTAPAWTMSGPGQYGDRLMGVADASGSTGGPPDCLEARPECTMMAGRSGRPPGRPQGSAGVDVGSAGPFGLGPAEHLPGDGGDLADAEEQEAEQVHGRVALGPLEVDVGADAGPVADVEQE